MWNAVQKGWAHPQHYAVCVRDLPKDVSEELVRLLFVARHCFPLPDFPLIAKEIGGLREKPPASTAAQTATL
jgi:hypothetical protein